MQYVAKYASKAEVRDAAYQDIAKTIFRMSGFTISSEPAGNQQQIHE